MGSLFLQKTSHNCLQYKKSADLLNKCNEKPFLTSYRQKTYIMDLNEASELFNTLLSQTNNKAEQRIYTSFAKTLSSLKAKDLNENQLALIEEKLTALELNKPVENNRKYYGKKLTEFRTFLKKEFSFTPEKYYTQIGLSLGMSLGVGIGLPVGMAINQTIGMSLGLSLGISLGMLFGILLGARKDAEAKRQGKTV